MLTVLFDLDGTIIDSFEGITKSVQYALHAQGIEVQDLRELTEFIGPPLKIMFPKKFGFDEKTTKTAIKKYRERFDAVGVFENELYPDVRETLQKLRDRGYPLALASSKPEDACIRILNQHGITALFDEIVGAALDDNIITKEDVLLEVFRRMKMKNPKDGVLIGDTIYDVEGAKRVGMDCIGVAYGFGKREDLEQAGAICICENLKEVVKEIEGYKTT